MRTYFMRRTSHESVPAGNLNARMGIRLRHGAAHRRTHQSLSVAAESRSVSRAIPALLGGVPAKHRFQVRTDRAARVNLATGIAMDRDRRAQVLDDRTLARREIGDRRDVRSLHPV